MLNVFSQENLQLRGQGPSNHPEKSWRLRVWQQIQPRGRFRGRTVSSKRYLETDRTVEKGSKATNGSITLMCL